MIGHIDNILTGFISGDPLDLLGAVDVLRGLIEQHDDWV